MPQPSYAWRSLTPAQRAELLGWRQQRGRPWHSPPHGGDCGLDRFHITAACYEHRPHIGLSPQRMEAFAQDLLEAAGAGATVHAWCVLPNHYHLLVQSTDVRTVLATLGRLHGRTSYAWNGQEGTRGRRVFYRAADRAMRSARHFWATVNYIHHNPVHHGYVERWQDWPWSSATEFLHTVGRCEAERIWREFPLEDYGKGWDGPQY
jgi:putative transposase